MGCLTIEKIFLLNGQQNLIYKNNISLSDVYYPSMVELSCENR